MQLILYSVKWITLFIIGYTLFIVLSPFIFIVNLLRKKVNYAKIATLGIDQAGGSIIYGELDWTISSYTYYKCTHGSYCWLMKAIDFVFGRGHCLTSFNNERRSNELL